MTTANVTTYLTSDGAHVLTIASPFLEFAEVRAGCVCGLLLARNYLVQAEASICTQDTMSDAHLDSMRSMCPGGGLPWMYCS